MNISFLKFISVFFLCTSIPTTATQTSTPVSHENLAAVDVLVHDHFKVPEQAKLPTIHLEKVDPAYAEQDYQALMAARQQIRQHLGTEWPAENLTVAENKASLINDLHAFNQKTNFTYHIFEPQLRRLIGCLYISKSGDPRYQAVVYYWLVPEVFESSIHAAIRNDLTQWMAASWPFTAIDYRLNSDLPQGDAI